MLTITDCPWWLKHVRVGFFFVVFFFEGISCCWQRMKLAPPEELSAFSCLPTYLSIDVYTTYLFTDLPICFPIYIPIVLSTDLPPYTPTFLSIYSYTYLPVYHYICLPHLSALPLLPALPSTAMPAYAREHACGVTHEQVCYQALSFNHIWAFSCLPT